MGADAVREPVVTPATAGRRSQRAGAALAVLLGLLAGAVQATIYSGFLSYTRRRGSGTGDSGFGTNPDIRIEALWLLGFVVATIVLVTVALALLRVRWYGLVMAGVVVLEVWVAALIALRLPGHSDWRDLALMPVLAVLLLVCRLALPRRVR